MSTEILQVDSTTYFIFGLRWVVLDALEPVSTQLNREREAGARWLVRVKNGIDENLGLAADLPESALRLRKSSKIRLISGAAQIAAHPEIAETGACLVTIEEPGVAPDPSIVAVVGIIAGNIVLDCIVNPSQVSDKREWFFEECSKRNIERVKTAGLAYSIAQPELELNWDDIVSTKKRGLFQRGYQIKPLEAQIDPKTLIWISLATLAVVVLIGVIWLWGYWRELEAKRQALAQELSITPIQRYLNALPNKLKQPVWLPTQLDEIVQEIDAYLTPSTRGGWQISSISCLASTQSCSFEWLRLSSNVNNKTGLGTMASFRDSLPTQEDIESATNPDLLNPVSIKRLHRGHISNYTPELITMQVKLSIPAKEAPPNNQWLVYGKHDVDEPSKWMRWKDLGAHFEYASPTIFGIENSSEIKSIENEPQVVKVLPWSIKEGALWQRELISELPPATVIESLSWKLNRKNESQSADSNASQSTATRYTFSASGHIFIARSSATQK